MNRIIKVGLLAFVASIQAAMVAGAFLAQRQMNQIIWDLEMGYKELFEQTHEVIIDFGLTPNPFLLLYLLGFLSLFITFVLLVDEIHQRYATG